MDRGGPRGERYEHTHTRMANPGASATDAFTCECCPDKRWPSFQALVGHLAQAAEGSKKDDARKRRQEETAIEDTSVRLATK